MIRFPSFAPDAPAPRGQLHGTRLSDWCRARNVHDVLRHNAVTRGDRTALSYIASGEGQEVPRVWTHRALFDDVSKAANVLRRLGAGRGDAVALLLPNLPEQQLIFWGAESVAVGFPLNFLLEPQHLAALLRAAKVRILAAPGPAVSAEIWNKALALREALGDQLEWVLQVGGPAVDLPGVAHFQTLMAGATPQVEDGALAALEDVAALFHTGGTTGTPKIVRQTHHNQLAAAFSGVCLSETTEADVCGNGYPMFHVAGAIPISLASFVRGGHLLLLSAAGFRDRSILANYWRIVERFGMTISGAVATAMSVMSEVGHEGTDLSSLRMAVSGGAFVPRAVAERFEQACGVPLREMYGMTETSGVIAGEPQRGERVLGSPGFIAPFMEAEIREVRADGTVGAALATGTAGVVVVRGEMVTPGYLQADHNASAFTEDGWFITGDLGRFDATGRLTLLGRSKDLIIRSGHNIDPQVIEEAALAHPQVSAAAAVGRPDRYAGELPVCFLVLRPGATVAHEELLQFIAERVPERPARPKEIHVIDALPVTGVGKIFKPALRRDAALRVATAELEGVPCAALEAVDGPGGRIVIRIRLQPGADTEAWRQRIAERLDAFLFQWELQP